MTGPLSVAGVMFIAIGVGIGVATRKQDDEDSAVPVPMYKDPIINHLTHKCRKRIEAEEAAQRYVCPNPALS